MEIERFNEILLQYNKDYLDIYTSDEYKFGCLCRDMLYNVKNGHFVTIFKTLISKVNKYKVRKLSNSHLVSCVSYENIPPKRIAVYKVVFGNYDVISEPTYIDSNCDYYIITDQDVTDISVWKKIDITAYISILNLSNIKKNRFFKFFPYRVFPDYEYSIYVDGNFELCGPISDLVQYINPKTGLGIHNMSYRDCIYDEIDACRILKKAPSDLLMKQKLKYETEGFPKHFGVYECPIIARRHTWECKEIMESWWEEYIDSSGRDQISLPYVIWKLGYEFTDVGFLGNNVWQNPYFRRTEHR